MTSEVIHIEPNIFPPNRYKGNVIPSMAFHIPGILQLQLSSIEGKDLAVAFASVWPNKRQPKYWTWRRGF